MGYHRIHTHKNPSDLLAQARAIRFAMKYGKLSYKEAKKMTEPLLQKVNEAGKKIALKHKRKYRKIRFSDL